VSRSAVQRFVTWLVVVLVVPAAVTATGVASATPQPSGAAAGADVHRLTLVTGDVVMVTRLADGRQVTTVDPASPTNGGIRSVTIDGDQYVFPPAAMPFIAAGTVDRRLFDVTALVDQGLTDDERHSLPLIVQYATTRAGQRVGVPDGAVRTRTLSSIDASAVTASKSSASDFWTDVTGTPPDQVDRSGTLTAGIRKIWLDGRVEATLADSVAQIGAPQAWAAGYDGTGTTVAVLDSGVDDEHPDLAAQIDAELSFVPGETTKDVNGHGTHVASTVLGTGAASSGVEKGVAPGARLIVGKVLGDDGFGQDSWIIDGMEWAAAHADVVSMSLGTAEPSDGTDPMSQAIDTLSADTNALFVVAAGNVGAEQSIGSPAAADAALTVGAVDGSDQLAWFSSMGPRFGDQAMKPDLVGPGVDINAARSQWTEGSGYYQSLSGTSMATPHVAGAAAVLAARHPAWGAVELKNALMSTSALLPGFTAYQVGAGRVDVAAAVLGEVHATGSVFFGFDRWPHPDTSAVQRTITYTNDGASPVTLDLGVEGTDDTGAPVPDGVFALSQSSVEVPANGSADVTVTLDRSPTVDGRRYTGQVVASVGTEVAAHTALGYVREDERYDLTISVVGRDGAPTQGYVELVGGPAVYDVVPVDGTATIRRPAGTFAAMLWLAVDTDTDHAGLALLSAPDIVLDRNRAVTLDARKAVPITVAVGRPHATATVQRMGWYRKIGDAAIEGMTQLPTIVDRMYATPTASVRHGQFEMSTRWRLRDPLLSVVVGDRHLDAIPLAGAALYDGSDRLTVVGAGQGLPSDYDSLDVSGKAVLVTRSDAIAPYERAVAAAEAGASLLIVANDVPAELSEWVGGPNGESPGLPVVGISGTEGARLTEQLAAGPVEADVTGRTASRWLYDLQDPHPGGIPSDLRYAPTPGDLARVRAEYAADRPTDGAEFRYDFRPYTFAGVGFMEINPMPGVRREWVSAPEGTTWYQEAMNLDGPWDQRSELVDYDPGERTTVRWFSPVVRPRIGEGYWKPNRDGDTIILNLPAWGDSGPGHTGDMYGVPGVDQHIELFAPNGSLLAQSDDQALYANAPRRDKARYRVVTRASRDADRWSTSTSTRTEWQFWSRRAATRADLLPLLSLDYHVDTDLAGRVGPGPTTVGLTVVPVPGSTFAGRVAHARMWASLDGGRTWQPASLRRESRDTWSTTIPRRGSADGTVALRAFGSDSAGNTVSQTVIAAYRLR
jgi:subtilisin family serine protease